MANTDIRTLRLFEFNRALSYVSKIIEAKREWQKLEKERISISREKCDWQREEGETKKEIEDISQIVEALVERNEEINYKQTELADYIKELECLVSKILEFVVYDKYLYLDKKEIDISFLEEYVYLLSEEVLDGETMKLGELLDNKADLALLIFENYGRAKEELFVDIVNTENNDSLPLCFEDYFPLS